MLKMVLVGGWRLKIGIKHLSDKAYNLSIILIMMAEDLMKSKKSDGTE